MTTRLGLHRPHVLTIATADRRKNLASLAVAGRRLAADGIDLVWAGDDRPYFSGSDAVPGLRPPGYVDDADLPGLSAGARVSSSRRPTRASDSPAWRRQPAGSRSWQRTGRRCPRPAAMPRWGAQPS